MAKRSSNANSPSDRGRQSRDAYERRGGHFPSGTLEELLQHTDQLPRGPAPGASVPDEAPPAQTSSDSGHGH